MLAASDCRALILMYDVQDLGGNQWRYEYTVVNSAESDVLAFTIAFDSTQSSNFNVSSAPGISSGWDELCMPYSSGTTLYDAYALGGGIASGASVGGFAVTFSYSGQNALAEQYYEIYDPQDFSVVASGWTVPIPEPATIILFGAGSLALRRAKK